MLGIKDGSIDPEGIALGTVDGDIRFVGPMLGIYEGSSEIDGGDEG
mgnify:CR=1 FL=1